MLAHATPSKTNAWGAKFERFPEGYSPFEVMSMTAVGRMVLMWNSFLLDSVSAGACGWAPSPSFYGVVEMGGVDGGGVEWIEGALEPFGDFGYLASVWCIGRSHWSLACSSAMCRYSSSYACLLMATVTPPWVVVVSSLPPPRRTVFGAKDDAATGVRKSPRVCRRRFSRARWPGSVRHTCCSCSGVRRPSVPGPRGRRPGSWPPSPRPRRCAGSGTSRRRRARR